MLTLTAADCPRSRARIKSEAMAAMDLACLPLADVRWPPVAGRPSADVQTHWGPSHLPRIFIALSPSMPAAAAAAHSM